MFSPYHQYHEKTTKITLFYLVQKQKQKLSLDWSPHKWLFLWVLVFYYRDNEP